MTEHTDDVDAALRAWGEDQRRTGPTVASPPGIADLLARHHRRNSTIAIAATVVLVTALAVGLGLAVQPGTSPASIRTQRHPTGLHQPVGATSRPCWQRFTDAGSRASTDSRTYLAVLRYTGDTTCRVSDDPQVALVGTGGRIVGPHAAPRTLSRFVSVHPGDTIRAELQLASVCADVPSGARYDLLVAFRPVAQLRLGDGIRTAVGSSVLADGRACTTHDSPSSVATTTSFAIVPRSEESTLADLTRIARREAESDDDASASAEAVRTTYGRVQTSILGTRSGQSSDNTVWVVQLHGRFVCTSCSAPVGAAAPRGRAVVLVLQEPGLRFSDSSISPAKHDLSRLGTVVPLLP